MHSYWSDWNNEGDRMILNSFDGCTYLDVEASNSKVIFHACFYHIGWKPWSQTQFPRVTVLTLTLSSKNTPNDELCYESETMQKSVFCAYTLKSGSRSQSSWNEWIFQCPTVTERLEREFAVSAELSSGQFVMSPSLPQVCWSWTSPAARGPPSRRSVSPCVPVCGSWISVASRIWKTLIWKSCWLRRPMTRAQVSSRPLVSIICWFHWDSILRIF